MDAFRPGMYPTQFTKTIQDETRPGMVSSNWVGYIVFNMMFVIYVGVNLQTIKLILRSLI